MGKDKRYTAAKLLIESGDITTFREIFNMLPKSVVYKDMGINYGRFLKLVKDTKRFTIEEIIRLSKHIGTDPKKILDMAFDQWVEDSKKTKGSK